MPKQTFSVEKPFTASVTALLLLGLISSCTPESSPSCHGAYDLYFVLDRLVDESYTLQGSVWFVSFFCTEFGELFCVQRVSPTDPFVWKLLCVCTPVTLNSTTLWRYPLGREPSIVQLSFICSTSNSSVSFVPIYTATKHAALQKSRCSLGLYLDPKWASLKSRKERFDSRERILERNK